LYVLKKAIPLVLEKVVVVVDENRWKVVPARLPSPRTAPGLLLFWRLLPS